MEAFHICDTFFDNKEHKDTLVRLRSPPNHLCTLDHSPGLASQLPPISPVGQLLTRFSSPTKLWLWDWSLFCFLGEAYVPRPPNVAKDIMLRGGSLRRVLRWLSRSGLRLMSASLRVIWVGLRAHLFHLFVSLGSLNQRHEHLVAIQCYLLFAIVTCGICHYIWKCNIWKILRYGLKSQAVLWDTL